MGQLKPPVTGQPLPTIDERAIKLRKTADAYGLKWEYSKGLGTFTNAVGQKETTWGMWAAEHFLRGYIFANSRKAEDVPPKGEWKDPATEDWGDWDED